MSVKINKVFNFRNGKKMIGGIVFSIKCKGIDWVFIFFIRLCKVYMCDN